MKPSMLTGTILMSLALAACSSTPIRSDDRAISSAVASAGAGGPRLPRVGEGYPDAAWLKRPLSLDSAVQVALLNNPRVRAEMARLDAAQAESVQAGLLRNPMGSLMTLRPDGGGRFELDYSLVQSLFDLFTRSRRIAVAEASRRAVEADVIGELVAIAQDTQAAYYEALIAAKRLNVQREQLAIDSEVMLLRQRQAGQGAIPARSTLEQQATVSMQAHQVQVAEAALTQARSSLAEQLGLSSSAALLLPDVLPDFSFPGLDDPALQALADARRPELIAAAAGIDQARAERQLQTGALRATDPSLGPAGIRESGGMVLSGLSIQLSVPVFDTGRARRDKTTAQVSQAEFAAEAIRRKVPLEVERAIATLVAANIAAGHADHHVYQQQQLERLARRGYEQGIADRSSYLQATRIRLDSVLEQVQTQQLRWQALIALERATGAAAAAMTGGSP